MEETVIIMLSYRLKKWGKHIPEPSTLQHSIVNNECISKETHTVLWTPASAMPNCIKNDYSLSPHGYLSDGWWSNYLISSILT